MIRRLRCLISNKLIAASAPWVLAVGLMTAAGSAAVSAQASAPEGEFPLNFAKAFMPETIGPGSVSMLIFTIENPSPSGTTGMNFIDSLPFGMSLAAPAFVSNTCGGTVTASDNGDEVSLVGGLVGPGQTCRIVVNVTATTECGADFGGTVVECLNQTGDLTSDAGNSGTASATLSIDTDRPGFSKNFLPSTVPFGGRSTLFFVVDNIANASNVTSLSFTDNLPAGMVVASPANASTDCEHPLIPATLTAAPGTSVVALSAFGTAQFPVLAAGATCSVVVDVIGGAVGLLGNVAGELSATVGNEVLSSGKAAAVLEVTGFEIPLALAKEFIDDPVPPGGNVTLEFTVSNLDRDFSATGIAFDDDLETALTGLAPSGPLPTDPCGAGSTLAFATGMLSLTGGTLGVEESCTFSVDLDIPADAAVGTYPNTTTAVTGTIDGEGVEGNAASDLLFVVSFPVLTKTFVGDPVGAGGTVTLEFTITNPETASVMTDIAFIDELTDGTASGDPTSGFLSFPVSVTLPPVPDPPCGAGSSLALVSLGTERQGLSLTGGSLAEGGMSGDSCTFSVTIDIPDGFPGGTYINTTEQISGVLEDLQEAPTVVGPPASDDVEIVGAPSLSKEFVDDPVLPDGGPVILEFNLQYSEGATGDATDVAFTDNLATLSPPVPSLVATSVDTNTCNGTVDIATDPTLIEYSGGTMAPGEACTITVTLTVPAASPVGFHTNTTSDITAVVAAVAVTGVPGQDDLLITPLLFTKEFVGDPTIAGDTVNLVFSIENLSAAAIDIVSFSDSLSAALPGLAATGPPTVNTCRGVLTGTTTLSYLGGSVPSAGICAIEVELLVPAMTPDDSYLNVTSDLITSVGVLPPATDFLTVQSSILELTKEFTDDPTQPEGTVTLEFTLTNLSATAEVGAISFDDDLDATLSGLVATGASVNTCGGMATGGFPTGMFGYSGGILAPSGTCSIVLSLDVPPGPLPGSVFPNTTSEVTGFAAVNLPPQFQSGLLVRGDPASDDLVINVLRLSKAFDGPTTATGSAVLTFTLENLDALNAASPLSFSDSLSAVIPGLTASDLPVAPCGGTVAGTGFLTFSGGSLAAGGTCSFDVTVNVPVTAAAGSFLNVTSNLTSLGLPVAVPATATLTIEPPPTFAKSFAPVSIPQDAASTLTFIIDDGASALAATALDFTDNLPAGVLVAAAPNASTTCTGGTVTAMAGSGVIGYTGGSVAAGASCTVQADVTSSVPGSYVNVTGDLTSSSGNSGTATDTLEVTDGIAPRVTNVGSIMDTGDGELAECETARTRVTALTVTFSEAMFEAVPTDPNSVTNPDNWFVVGSGADQDLSTTACGPTSGDDTATAIDSVTYDGGSLTATVAFEDFLADGPYRLIACSGGLVDVNTNALDGDGNGTGGDDFVRTFRVDRRDAFDNGNFDCTLDGWLTPLAVDTFAGTEGVDIQYSTEDVNDASISGSAEFTNPPGNFDLSLGQCVGLLPESIYELSGFVRLNTGGVAIEAVRACEFYASSDCSGPAFPVQAFFNTIATPDVWVGFANELTIIETVHSGLCQLTLRNLAGLPYSANADDMSMDALFTMILFQDGFESGDTSAWSTTVP